MEKLDLQGFEAGYSDEGHLAYHPALLLKVWLYAYALGMTSSRRLEQRLREDLAFRYLAGGAQPDYWALNEFRKRHGCAMNDVFTQICVSFPLFCGFGSFCLLLSSFCPLPCRRLPAPVHSHSISIGNLLQGLFLYSAEAHA